MTLRIAILTPDPEDEAYQTRWRETFERQAGLLRKAGMTVDGPPWVEPDLAGFDLIMPLLVWGYHRAGDAWRAATAAWERSGLPVANPPTALRWNADKIYLGRLAERGAPIVPTRFVDRVDEDALTGAAAAFGTETLIAKPRVSASAWQTIRWSPGAPLVGAPTGPALIQPYLANVEDEGELSLIYLGGAFSHAIRKVPRPGDFRVQPEYDGVNTQHRPAPDELEAAEAVLAAIEEPLLYARIDIMRVDGRPSLVEAELVEPDLYLEFDGQDGGPMFAEAVMRAVHSSALPLMGR